MTSLIWIALGGALGAVARAVSVGAAMRVFGPGFPWGVAAVNAAGSFAMGLAAVWLVERGGDPRLTAFVMPGLLGGFTTFSAFSLDAARLIEDGRIAAASAYMAGSVGLALVGLFAGLALGRAWS